MHKHDRKLFHATYGPYVNSILTEGLVAGKSPANWGDSLPDHIYLTSDPSMARFFAETAEKADPEWSIHVFEVTVDNETFCKLEPDASIYDARDVFQYSGSFPPHQLALAD